MVRPMPRPFDRDAAVEELEEAGGRLGDEADAGVAHRQRHAIAADARRSS